MQNPPPDLDPDVPLDEFEAMAAAGHLDAQFVIDQQRRLIDRLQHQLVLAHARLDQRAFLDEHRAAGGGADPQPPDAD